MWLIILVLVGIGVYCLLQVSKSKGSGVNESNAEKQPGRFDGERSTTPYESQKVPADGRQDIKFADKLNIYYDEVISVLRDAESILILPVLMFGSSSSFGNFSGGTVP